MKSTDSTRHVPSSRELLALATLLATAGSQSATAQTVPPASAEPGEPEQEAGDLPETVVDAATESPYNPQRLSSEKFTAPLLDTPQSFTVIPKEVYTQQNARNLTDVLKNTPGISFNAGENGFASGIGNFSMRGFNASGDIFVDGIRDSGNYLRDVFNLERVEVVKGPAADSGRGSAGGYVNLVTKTPFAQDATSGTMSYGFDEYSSENRFRTTLDMNRVLDVQSLPGTAIRLNALLQEGGVAGRDVAEMNSWGVAPSITFGLGSPTRLTLAYQYVEQRDLPDWGVPAALIDGTINHDSTLPKRKYRDTFYGLKSDFDDVDSHSLLAVVEHDFASGLTLSNTTRWGRTDRDAVYTIPFNYNPATRQVTTQQQAYQRDNTILANRTNLSYEFETGSLKHTLATGIEVAREEAEAGRFGTVNDPGGPVGIANPDPDRAGILLGGPTQFADVRIDTLAAYAYDTVEINRCWELTGGIRVERYEVDLESRDAAGNRIGAANYSKSDTTVGGKLGLVYKPAENGSIYAAVGLAALPPGSFLSNPDISRTGDNAFPGAGAGLNSRDARTQESLNYELGTKWNFFGDRLTTTAALFRTERRNVAITGKTPGDPTSPTVLQGYGEQIVEGIEFGASGQITDNWNIFAGLLLMDSERKHSSFLDAARREADPGDYGAETRTSGDELAFTPNVTANLWTTYRFPVGLTVGGGLQYVGSSYVGRPDDAERIIPNGATGKLPDYVVFNAMMAYEVNENVTLRLNVDNVFDEVYAVSMNWPARRATLGTPRTYTISAVW